MLCAYSTSNLPTKGTFKLWVLKDYGVKEYWTSLLNIEDPCISYMAIPKYRFADGELLYWFLSYQHKAHAFKTYNGPFGLWPQCDTLQNGITFTESLISPKSLI
uniref:F-box family protein n=1 Tax=Solanum tuberosum TaxID=4113 RepID=M1B1A5_SOLTU